MNNKANCICLLYKTEYTTISLQLRSNKNFMSPISVEKIIIKSNKNKIKQTEEKENGKGARKREKRLAIVFFYILWT